MKINIYFNYNKINFRDRNVIFDFLYWNSAFGGVKNFFLGTIQDFKLTWKRIFLFYRYLGKYGLNDGLRFGKSSINALQINVMRRNDDATAYKSWFQKDLYCL